VSRIGLRPIPVPSDVKVKIEGEKITVEGKNGTLERSFPQDIAIKQEEGNLIVSRPSNGRVHRSLHGLSRTLLANMVEGVSKGFEKVLELSGVGYRAQKTDTGITLQVGFCHPVEIAAPPGITFTVEGNNRIKVSGIDKEMVGQTAAEIRAIRRTDSYKGKGVKYQGERLRLKAGKSGKTALRR
jgi:large subunit ribosomal protein L6